MIETVNKRCYIAGAGEFCDRELPEPGDYVIAADAGYSALISRGITPDLVVGDFDSLGSAPDHPNVFPSPVEKDDTDMMLAVRQGLARGFTRFVINGGLGGKLDHTLANIQALAFLADNDATGILFGRDICVTAVKDGVIEFDNDTSGRVSIFCAGEEANGVTLTGLKYSLDNATLTSTFPLGVSNEFTGVPATISVRSGTLIVIYENSNFL